MELIKRLSLILLLLCTTSSLWSNGGLQFKGKLRILRPTTLQVKDLNGNLVLTCSISQNGVFETEKKEIQPTYIRYVSGKRNKTFTLKILLLVSMAFSMKRIPNKAHFHSPALIRF